jgi:hypothetical protein
VPTASRSCVRAVGAERGTATVEFALLLPLLLVMCLALVQADETAIREAALAAGPGLDPGAVTIGVTRDGTVGDPVTVEVGYAESIRVPFVDWLFGDTVSMKASATNRQEFA